MRDFLTDLRITFRSLRRSPGLTVAVTLSLALGIGGTTAIFSLFHGVVLRPLPFHQPDRLVDAGHALPGEYLLFREQARSFDALAIHGPSVGVNLFAEGDPERVRAVRISPNLFRTLGVAPFLGRDFAAEAERPGEDQVVLLSHALYRERFGADPALIGETILIDSEPRTVVGVMPPGFAFPDRGTRLWLPLPLDPADPVALWGGGGGPLVGRLATDMSAAGALAELRGLGDRVRDANSLWSMPEEYGGNRSVISLQESMAGDVRTPFLVLLGAVAFILLIACANVANLLLARSLARQRELALRIALGAGRRRILRQLLTESVTLAGLGGAVGLLVAVGGVRFLAEVLPVETVRLGEVGLDGVVLAFAGAVTLLSGIAFGLVPVFRASRPNLRGALHEGSHGPGAGRERRRLSSGLVAGEIALSVVLVIGAGLMGRSLWELSRVDPGFDADRLVVATVTPSETRYEDPARERGFVLELLEQVRASPGLGEAEAVDHFPLAEGEGFPEGFAFETEDDPYVPGAAAPTVAERRVTPGYLRALGIPLLRGRPLAEQDREDAPHVALVNEAMARETWPGQDPIGKRFRPVWWEDGWITVVGVAGDVRQASLAAEPEPEVYRPLRQSPTGSVTLVFRTAAEPGAIAGPLREAVRAVDPQAPVSRIRSVRDVRSGSLAEPRGIALLLGAFALLAVGLAVVGIYGLVSFSVVQRTREFGIRMALGARDGDVLRLVLRQGAGLLAVGAVTGLGLAFALARWMEGLLFGVTAWDPVTFLGVPLVLAATVFLACWIPARRAASVQPALTLKAE